MFALALVVMPFSDTDPAEAIRASLARYRRGKSGEVLDEWLAFDDITPLLREAHEASMAFTARPAEGLSVKGQIDVFHLLNHRWIRDEMNRRGLETWSIRFADEMDLDAFRAEFSKSKLRDAKAGLYGRWLNGLGRWDWGDLSGRFGGAILGERREVNGRAAGSCRKPAIRSSNRREQMTPRLAAEMITSILDSCSHNRHVGTEDDRQPPQRMGVA